MIRYFVLIAIACASLFLNEHNAVAQEPKLHVLGLFDTLDERVGEGVKVSRDRLFEVLVRSFDEDGRRHRMEHVILAGVDATKSRVLDYYKNLKVRSSDTVLLFYNGHGGEDVDNGHFLALRDGRLDRTDLRLAMLKKGARQTIIISDCCSNLVGAGSPIPQQELNWDVVNQLMFQQRGLTDLTSAEKGNFAFVNRNLGGMFTRALVANLCEEPSDLDQDGDHFVTWKEFASRVSVATNKIFREAYEEYPYDSEFKKLLRSVDQDSLYTRRFYLNDTDLKVFYRRKLKFSNQSGYPVTVKLVYRGKNTSSQWDWIDATPGDQKYGLRKGASGLVRYRGENIEASRIRFYAFAVGTSRYWRRTQSDIWIAPSDGYLANEMTTFTYNLTSN